MTGTTAGPDRIRTMRHVNAMAAPDTAELLADRVSNLLSAGRRITTVRRYLHDDQPPEVTAGLTLHNVKEWSGGITVQLEPGLTAGFGFAALAAEDANEAAVWRRYYAEKRDLRGPENMTEVRITGGLPGDGPARDDRIVIRRWNSEGTCVEVVVAFDYGTGPCADARRAEVEGLEGLR